MRHRVASILFFVLFASLALACEAVSHSNDFEQASQTQTIQSCGAGALSCNGVCTTVDADQNNCGACGKVCPAGELCSSGSCGSSCTGGLTQCGSKCVDTQNDPNNCGGCGGPDGGGSCPICQDGVCRTQCLGGQAVKFCKNRCVDTQSDPDNCGNCAGNPGAEVCTGAEVCSSGSCVLSCGAGLTKCDSSCFDLSHDADHCGSCDATPCPIPPSNGVAVCVPSPSTGNFTCGVACNEGFTYCVDHGPNNTYVSVCTDVSTDVLNCGTCRTQCGISGNNPFCHQGACTSG
ncbi:MAG: hypothetical protein ACRELY_11030 [Polyangiaceae bacterium]